MEQGRGTIFSSPSKKNIHRPTTRRRRRLKWRVYAVGLFFLFMAVQYNRMSSLSNFADYVIRNDELPTSNRVVLRDDHGTPVRRNATSLADFLSFTVPTVSNSSTIDLERAIQDRIPILNILKDAGVKLASDAEVMALPRWKQIEYLYGSEPVIVGLDSCQSFQRNIPRVQARYVGVSGMFNSGTTAFGISLQANCRFQHHRRNMTNDVLSDSNGMLSQVPWAKHKMATEKNGHTIHAEIPKEHVLPIVLVRDPFFWMQSMCKQGYGARWTHDSRKHCPNLVPNDFDRIRFRDLHNASSVTVWMGKNPKVGPSWPSLVHYYSDWYQSYVQASFPRLMIRFEDTLFHGADVMKKVCECAGGEPVSSRHQYLLDEAKWSHRQEQNNFISALIRYGSDDGRYRNMTSDDLKFASENLDESLLQLFRYKKAAD